MHERALSLISADTVIETLSSAVPTDEQPTAEWTRVLLGALARLGEERNYCIEPAIEAFDLEHPVPKREFLGPYDLELASLHRCDTDPISISGLLPQRRRARARARCRE